LDKLKNMKYFLCIIILILSIDSVLAQNENKSILTKIELTVTDSLTNQKLSGATVSINYGESNNITDKNGTVSFSVKPGNKIITVKYVGYKPFRVSLPIYSDIKLNVSLIEVSQDLEDLIISSKNISGSIKRPILGVNSLNIKSLQRIPTAMGEVDILRGLQMLPGVTSVGEAANGVNIRGGTTDQNLLLLDDAPIFNPTHMFGLFSAFPSEAVSSFDLYKGNVPSRFGGRAAAVLDVSLSQPSLTRFSMQGGISFVSNRIKLDIPIIKDKLGIMISGRGAFNDFLFPIISDKLSNIKAKFGDGAIKVFYKANSKNTISYSGYYSKDLFQTAILGSIGDINSTSTKYDYETLNHSLNWFKSISNNLNIQTKLIFSDYVPITLLPEINSDNVVKIKSGIDYKQLKSNINYSKGIHKIESGFDVIHYSINPGELLPGTSLTVKPTMLNPENAYELGLYVEDELEINSKLTISGGLRYSQFLNMGPSTVNVYNPNLPIDINFVTETKTFEKGQIVKSYGGFEPRFGLKYSLDKNKSLKLGYNLMRQYLQVITNTTTPLPTSRWKTSDEFIKPQIGSLYTVGYGQNFNQNIYEISVETYLRNTKNILDYKPGADFLLSPYPEISLLSGINKSYGLELMVSKKKGEMTGWLNYTYSKSLNKVDNGPEVDQKINLGDWYASNYDRPHSVNASMIIAQGKHHDFSFNFTYSTGRPFTTPNGYILYQDKTYPFYDKRNNDRIPDYHRLDFAWNIYNPSLKEKKWKGNWTFTVYNLYGRKNAYSIFLRTQGTAVKAYKLTVFGAPIISLSYNFKFNN
jgi:hypothetical protein